MTSVRTLRTVPHNGGMVPKGEVITDAAPAVVASWLGWKWVELVDPTDATPAEKGKADGRRKRS